MAKQNASPNLASTCESPFGQALHFFYFIDNYCQVFPAEYGWPFPKFYGACGRAIVVEDVGKTLDMYLTKSWSVRVTLALSVLELARRLTLSEHGWALYMSDPFMENFAVTEDLEVKLIDAEHLVVVDLWTIPSQQGKLVP